MSVEKRSLSMLRKALAYGAAALGCAILAWIVSEAVHRDGGEGDDAASPFEDQLGVASKEPLVLGEQATVGQHPSRQGVIVDVREHLDPRNDDAEMGLISGVVRIGSEVTGRAGASVVVAPTLYNGMAVATFVPRRWLESASISVTTDKFGKFAVPARCSVTYEVKASSEGFLSKTEVGVTCGAHLNLELTKLWQVSGRLVSPAGTPQEFSGKVKIYREIRGRQVADTAIEARPGGDWSIELVGGKYWVRGFSDRHLPSEKEEFVLAGDGCEDIDLRLVAGLLVNGIVESGGGVGVPHATIDLLTSPGAQAEADSSGRFAIAIPPDTMAVLGAHAPGFAKAEVKVDPQSVGDGAGLVRITLSAPAIVEVQVVRASGEAVGEGAGLLVSRGNMALFGKVMYRAGDTHVSEIRSDGTLVFDGVRAGVNGGILVSTPRGETGAYYLPPVQPGSRNEMGTLQVSMAGALQGRVLGADGQPLRSCRVTLHQIAIEALSDAGLADGDPVVKENMFGRRAVTNEAGEFFFGRLAAGRVVVIPQSAPEEDHEALEVDIRAGKVTRMGDLTPPGGEEGRVLAIEEVVFIGERPEGKLIVRVEWSDGRAQNALDESGRIRLAVPHLPEERFAVEVLAQSDTTYLRARAELEESGDGKARVVVKDGTNLEVLVEGEMRKQLSGERLRINQWSGEAQQYAWVCTLRVDGVPPRIFVQGDAPLQIVRSKNSQQVLWTGAPSGLREIVLR